ncbi:folate-binding protein [uncultured Aliiroseovarius sp.]|uniref:CAF17-like 4Fe-4S cluster assembly/insertion protein YgfZ n=1 Tax=uncultured Aliiroseovarius sp. TaxID=1658783 RepID=UPI0026142F16|nr:folate-binding protein [uncultured Aliiroseovarius sp.]
MTDRTVLKVSGADRESFLQGLVSNDVKGLKDGLVYAALLTPQGKYLADFLLVPAKDAILIDVATDLARSLAQRLTMYKLRADVVIEATDIMPARGLGEAPEGAFADPRHAELGWRAYDGRESDTSVDWDAIRVAHCIPETGIELTGDSYLLEAGFERLNGVDFRKGCYVGQEVTARMKHKTELKKGLATVSVDGEAPVGMAITRDGKPVGTLFTQSDGQAIAYLRFDRAGPGMQAGDAVVSWEG